MCLDFSKEFDSVGCCLSIFNLGPTGNLKRIFQCMEAVLSSGTLCVRVGDRHSVKLDFKCCVPQES